LALPTRKYEYFLPADAGSTEQTSNRTMETTFMDALLSGGHHSRAAVD
jgi:hypothetical protein